MANQKPREVQIEVDPGTGDIIYHPAVLHGRRSEQILWKCQSGPFAIQFADRTPLETADDRSALRGSEWVVEKTVRGDASPGTYRYACAVYAGERVFIDAGCPVIIIDL